MPLKNVRRRYEADALLLLPLLMSLPLLVSPPLLVSLRPHRRKPESCSRRDRERASVLAAVAAGHRQSHHPHQLLLSLSLKTFDLTM
jgi:hypothetical protein